MTSIDEILANLDQKQFVNDWNAGASFEELKQKFGLHRDQAIRVAKSLSLREKIPKYDKKILEIDKSEFVKDWNSGLSLVELAGKYDLSYPEKAKMIAQKLGLPTIKRNSTILPDIDVSEFEKDWKSGLSLVELAAKYGFSYPEKAKRIAKKLGLSMIKQNSTFLPKFKVSEFEKDWNSDMSRIALAHKYGFSYSTQVKRISEKLGLNQNLKRKKSHLDLYFDKLDIHKFKNLYDDHEVSIIEICKILDIPHRHYVNDFANRLGLILRPPGFKKWEKFEIQKEEFRKLWLDNIKIHDIAKKLGISDITVFFWKKKLNLPNRDKGRHVTLSSDPNVSRIVSIIESEGAITLSDLVNRSRLSRTFIENLIKDSDILETMILNLKDGKEMSTVKYFGDYAGDTVIFPKGDYYDAALCILDILKKNPIESQNDNYKINIMESTLKKYPLEKYPGSSNFLSVNAYLRKYEMYHHKRLDREKLSDIKKITSSKKDFGYKVEGADFVNELNNSDIENQRILMKSLFWTLGYSVMPDKPPFDFMIIAESNIHVKLEIYRSLSKSDIRIISEHLKDEDRIIVTLQPLSEEIILDEFPKIEIVDKEKLMNFIPIAEYLPSRIGNLSRITIGDELNDGKFVRVQQLNFVNNFATSVEVLNNLKLRIPILSLKEILPSSKINSNEKEFYNVLKKIDILSKKGRGYQIVDFPILLLDMKFERKKYWRITARVGENIVSIVAINEEFKKEKIVTEMLSSCIGYCRNIVVKCNCLEWLEQSENYYICRHVSAIIFHLWENNLRVIKEDLELDYELNKFDEKKIEQPENNLILGLLDEIVFLMRVGHIIEIIWEEFVELNFNNSQSKSLLYHYLIKYVIMNGINNITHESFNALKRQLILDLRLTSLPYTEIEIKQIYNILVQKIQSHMHNDLIVNMDENKKSRIISLLSVRLLSLSK